jgi:hypothetical protein
MNLANSSRVLLDQTQLRLMEKLQLIMFLPDLISTRREKVYLDHLLNLHSLQS